MGFLNEAEVHRLNWLVKCVMALRFVPNPFLQHALVIPTVWFLSVARRALSRYCSSESLSIQV